MPHFSTLAPSGGLTGPVVAVFAHNEARRIAACIDSLAASADLHGARVYVLANGCTDDTAQVVQALCARYDWLQLVELALADKAAAWNHFVHHLAGDAQVACFVDGDCRIAPGALAALALALARQPDTLVASGVPALSMTSTGAYRRHLLRQGGVAGNLYALSARFLAALQARQVALPQGLIGDDSLVGWLACSNLQPASPWDEARVQVVPEACFAHETALGLFVRSPASYGRRLLRYSLRRFQNLLLSKLLVRDGLAAMPRDVAALYRGGRGETLRLRRRWPDLWFDWRARRMIRALSAPARD